jgi:hypothetical protein
MNDVYVLVDWVSREGGTPEGVYTTLRRAEAAARGMNRDDWNKPVIVKCRLDTPRGTYLDWIWEVAE